MKIFRIQLLAILMMSGILFSPSLNAWNWSWNNSGQAQQYGYLAAGLGGSVITGTLCYFWHRYKTAELRESEQTHKDLSLTLRGTAENNAMKAEQLQALAEGRQKTIEICKAQNIELLEKNLKLKACLKPLVGTVNEHAKQIKRLRQALRLRIEQRNNEDKLTGIIRCQMLPTKVVQLIRSELLGKKDLIG